MRHLAHLVGRFFDVLTSRPLRPAEQAEVATALRSEAERAMFWDQSHADQRHGLAAARHIRRLAPGRGDLERAALLHDTGKRHARLGIIGRVVASLARLAGRRGSGRVGRYLDHGPVAAAELELAGAEALVVDFARHHHGSRPDSVSADDWDLLEAADRVRR